jgi:hypothetical protein
MPFIYRSLVFAIFLMNASPLQSEIQEVTVTWTAAFCINCSELITRYVKQIQGVEDIQMKSGIGQINLKWKPGVAFEFTPIKNAFQMVGLGLNDIRMQVRGRIKHDKQNVYLISETDNTGFLLLNPVYPEEGYTMENSHYTHDLSPRLREKLLELERTGEIVVIKGPLFEPYRSPPEPLKLQVAKLDFEEKERN